MRVPGSAPSGRQSDLGEGDRADEPLVPSGFAPLVTISLASAVVSQQFVASPRGECDSPYDGSVGLHYVAPAGGEYMEIRHRPDPVP